MAPEAENTPMQQLSPQDAQFLYSETRRNPSIVTLMSIFDPSTVPGGKVVRFKEIVRHVESRLHANPFMTQKLLRVPMELDYPYWIEDEFFDIEFHIHHSRLPAPGDWRQLCIYTARYHSRPMDMSRPPWEMNVIEGLDHIAGLPKGCYGVATRIHHSALDGAGMSRFMLCMMDKDEKGTAAMPLDATPVARNARPSAAVMLGRATLNNLRAPINLMSTAAKVAPAAIETARDNRSKQQREKKVVPKTRFDVEVAAHKAFDGTEFNLDELKAIRKLVDGATINDVVLAVCGSALRRYLEKHDELPDESLIAWVPINARPGGARDNDAAGNNIGAMTVPIYTNIADPLVRLQSIHEKTRQRKQSSSGGSAKLMTELSKNLPAASQFIVAKLAVKAGLIASACNLFISNVAGSQEPLYMNGSRQLTGFGMAPLTDGLGLFIAVPSYNGKIGFHVTSTREIMPDIRFFVECIEAGVAELKEATGKT